MFKKGQLIRVDISSSNFPHFDAYPHTGGPDSLGLHFRVARNTVFVDAQRPSHVLLPLIPRRA